MQRELFSGDGATDEPEEDGITLVQAKAELTAGLEEGIACPCCGQFAKLYERRINSGLAACLVWLVREYLDSKDWIDVPRKAPRFVLRNREMGRLRHWGLVVQQKNEDKAKKTSGMWKPTTIGVKFVCRELTVPKKVRLFNNQFQGFSDEEVGILECLGDKFDYNKLMGRS
jgi:hypothetical protein